MAKKYIRLTGNEVATPENEARGNDFLNWFAQNREDVLRCINIEVDYDLVTDAMLNMYDCIALKGFTIENYKSYYLMAYRNTFLAARKGAPAEDIEGLNVVDAEVIAPPQFDEAHLLAEILEYVRGNYDTVSVSIFEIYATLYPEFSSASIAELTGLPISRVKATLSAIKKDVADTFVIAHATLLSQL